MWTSDGIRKEVAEMGAVTYYSLLGFSNKEDKKQKGRGEVGRRGGNHQKKLIVTDPSIVTSMAALKKLCCDVLIRSY